MVKSLIRMKSFNKVRLLGKYRRVIIDGTGLLADTVDASYMNKL